MAEKFAFPIYLSYSKDLSIYGFNICCSHNLYTGNEHDSTKSHILMLLQIQEILGNTNHQYTSIAR